MRVFQWSKRCLRRGSPSIGHAQIMGCYNIEWVQCCRNCPTLIWQHSKKVPHSGSAKNLGNFHRGAQSSLPPPRVEEGGFWGGRFFTSLESPECLELQQAIALHITVKAYRVFSPWVGVAFAGPLELPRKFKGIDGGGDIGR